MVWSSVQELLPSCSTSGGHPARVAAEVVVFVLAMGGCVDGFGVPVPFIEVDQAEKAAPDVHDRQL